MRSSKKTALALVALVGLLLTGCSSAGTATDFASVSCSEVSTDLVAANQKLTELKDSAKKNDGTAQTAFVSSDLKNVEAEVAGLSARASECKVPATEAELANFTQCRVNAVMTYMAAKGFTDGQYVIGEDRIDKSLAEFASTGSLGYVKEGEIPDSRAALQEVFDSSNTNLNASAEAQVRKFPNIDRNVVLNSQNWEIVQMTIPVQISGNTGLDGSTQIDAGTRSSAAGDAAWIFVDTSTCLVATSTIDSMGRPISADTPEAQKPIGFIRVGCGNPGDGFVPPPPPAAPPGTPENPPQIDAKIPGQDPYPQGNAPVGGGPNANSGPDVYIPPAEMTQPPATPYVPPAPPAPVPPAPQPPTSSNPNPDPVPTRDPAPPPPPQPSAPPPSVAPSTCPIPPGQTSC